VTPLSAGEVLRRSTAYLAGKGSPTARLDAELLLAHGLGLSRVELYTHHDRPLTAEELAVCRELVRRRGEREPVAYIIGHWGFRRLDLQVDRRVLIPRPETELLVERGLALVAETAAPRVLDVGTGSGAVALAIAAEHPGARVTATDVSPDALAVAAANAGRLGLDVELLLSDLLHAVSAREFDLVLSNPPYVSRQELSFLEPEVSRWEPALATVAGDDGLAVYRRLLPAVREVLARGGHVAVECGAGQAAAVRDELARLGYGDVFVDRDLTGIERVVGGRWV
jgi:release factor glutamine methyltransferase